METVVVAQLWECTKCSWTLQPIKWLFYVVLYCMNFISKTWAQSTSRNYKKIRNWNSLFSLLNKQGRYFLCLMHIAFSIRWKNFSNTATSSWIQHSPLSKKGMVGQTGEQKEGFRPDSRKPVNWAGHTVLVPVYPSTDMGGIRSDEWLLYYLLKSVIC